ncbi:hypothetical protein [Streptomyces sp. CA2R106]|uniref:hypothetical protein n=1 Tax=Streptomyces sp. CA2R106 TaxID=3120153 RepID=UPI003009279E
MADDSFGVLLERLALGKMGELVAAAHQAGTRSELEAVLRGGSPGSDLLRVLAPVLGWHAADVFALADVSLPDDLRPADRSTGGGVPALVRSFIALGLEQQAEVLHFVASMPAERPAAPVRTPPHMVYPSGPGGILMRLARNRGLGWSATAQTLAVTTGRYWSAATYGGMGHGRVSLSSELLGDFSALLDISEEDLTAVTGTAFPVFTAERKADLQRVGDLIWQVRCLSASQLGQARARADAMAVKER